MPRPEQRILKARTPRTEYRLIFGPRRDRFRVQGQFRVYHTDPPQAYELDTSCTSWHLKPEKAHPTIRTATFSTTKTENRAAHGTLGGRHDSRCPDQPVLCLAEVSANFVCSLCLG